MTNGGDAKQMNIPKLLQNFNSGADIAYNIEDHELLGVHDDIFQCSNWSKIFL
jgi:hypothetical protein